jgi:DNA-binding NarL/FixJ family response regulator
VISAARPPEPSPALRVLLVDDHPALLAGLVSLLSRSAAWQVVGTAADGDTALALIDRAPPDLVVLDVAMPGTSGIEVTRRLRARHPKVRVLAYSQYGDATTALSMLRAGASGFLTKAAGLPELETALRCIASNERYVDPRLPLGPAELEDLLAQPPAAAESPLTDRESDVLALLTEGLSSKQIAGRLDIAKRTVDFYRAEIARKLGVKGSVAMAKRAEELGLVARPRPPEQNR